MWTKATLGRGGLPLRGCPSHLQWPSSSVCKPLIFTEPRIPESQNCQTMLWWINQELGESGKQQGESPYTPFIPQPQHSTHTSPQLPPSFPTPQSFVYSTPASCELIKVNVLEVVSAWLFMYLLNNTVLGGFSDFGTTFLFVIFPPHSVCHRWDGTWIITLDP